MNTVRAVAGALRAWLAGAPGWLGGVLAGGQAALLSLAVILLPTWAAAAATPPAEPTGGTDWGAAAAVASKFWLLGFGVPWELDSVEVTLPPLGIAALTLAILIALARRFADKTWTSWLCAVAAFAAVVIAVTVLTWGSEPDASSRAVKAGLFAVGLAAPAVAVGIWRAHGATLAWLSSLPVSLRTGLRLGAATMGAHVVLAAAVGTVWTIAGRHAIAETATGLQADGIGGVALAALEVLYVPTLAVWYMAWDVGAGFAVGLAHFAPAQITQAPLPQIPLLGALPTAAGGALVWIPAIVIVVVAAIRLMMRARMPEGAARWWAALVAIACVGAGAAVLGLAATGAAGPGSLETVGVEVGPFAALVAAASACGLALGEGLDRASAWLGLRSTPARQPVTATRREPARRAEGVPTAGRSRDTGHSLPG